MNIKTLCIMLLCIITCTAMPPAHAQADTQNKDIFIEAEDFTIQGNGWRINTNAQARRASGVQALNGSTGAVDSTATYDVNVTAAGEHRLWVRYMAHDGLRGPFVVRILQDGSEIAAKTFDTAPVKVARWEYTWDHLDANLKPGKYTLELSKHEKKNTSGYVRNVDAFLLTTDKDAKPTHIPYAPQTWMRFTLHGDHGGPVQIHLFADHYRSPWYAHYAISKDGMEPGLNPKRKEALLGADESTGWVNVTPGIYEDSGARFYLYTAHTYHQEAKVFNATIDIATAPSDDAIVKTYKVEREPGKLQLMLPGHLRTPENIKKIQTDLDISQRLGKLADDFDWPTVGRAPTQVPFFVSAKLSPSTMGSQVHQREIKTIDYFGFNNVGKGRETTGYTSIGNVGWHYNKTYSAPDIERLEKNAPIIQKRHADAGIKAENIVFAMVMDEPGGQSPAVMVDDQPSIDAFRAWLKRKNLTPQDLLVASWDEVRPVVESQKDTYPALHYYTQQFRTVALGDFIALQKRLLHQTWDADFPVNVNFSDGAVYYANLYGQGVDYFTLLRETDQNAIWSEDWSNVSSTFHMATYNVELMRAAAREKGQHLGQHLIAYAGRRGYDVRLKVASEAARGIKVFYSYAYGPQWSGHDLSAWQSRTEIWRDHAYAIREIGAVEDLLMPAMPKTAQVAIIYSSAADIWANGNNTQGFDRMHTWLAMTHEQVPVDIVHETQIESDMLDGYRVAYLSGTHITQAAAEKLAKWVDGGGTLVLTAGAAMRDQYNRPLDTLDKLLPFKRSELDVKQTYAAGGRNLVALKPIDTVQTTHGAQINVLGSKQTFELNSRANTKLLARFADGSPAAIQARVGKGSIVAQGYLPALDYITKALNAKAKFIALDAESNNEPEAEGGIPGAEAIHKMLPSQLSYNPWEYPADVRQAILQPVHEAKLDLPISCDTPLVDAVYMTSEKGIVVPLANYTLKPIKQITLELAVDKPYKEVRSVHQGKLNVTKINDKRIRVTLPLICTDYITIAY